MAKVNKVSAFVAVTKALEAGKNDDVKKMQKILSESIEKEMKHNESFKEYKMTSNEKKLFMI